MIIEFREKPVSVDGEPFATNVGVNIQPSRRQARIVMRLLKSSAMETEQDIDLVIYTWSYPKFEKLSVVASMSGEDYLHRRRFSLKYRFDPLKGKHRIQGSIGAKPIEVEAKHVADLLKAFVAVI